MPEWTPEEVLIRRRALTVLRGVLSLAMPLEGCALLLGWGTGAPGGSPARSVTVSQGFSPEDHACPGRADGATALTIGLIWPCLNVWEPAAQRGRRFLIDPREQLLAQRWCRQRGLQVLGSAHSHPCSEPRPSCTDLELAMAPTLQLILSPLAGWEPACWWLELSPRDHPEPRPLRWRMVD